MAAGIAGHLFAITGAASGIGRATAELLASNGALLSLADKNGDAVQQLAESLAKQGAVVYSTQVDVTVRKEVEAWMKETVKRFERMLDGE
jgi:NADP-dependent 3-hydroxy acid dehydrogenase YdfG